MIITARTEQYIAIILNRLSFTISGSRPSLLARSESERKSVRDKEILFFKLDSTSIL